MGQLPDVFENANQYDTVYKNDRLKANARHVILCYKAQMRLNSVLRKIQENAGNKYSYIRRARYLLWALIIQGILNEDQLERRAQDFGRTLTLETGFNEWMLKLGASKSRMLIGEAIAKDKEISKKVEEEKYEFLRTQSFYEKCMDLAYREYRWTPRRLNGS